MPDLQTNGDAKGGADIVIDAAVFGTRLKAFYKSWQDHADDFWGGAAAVSLATGPHTEDLRYLKSSAFQIWLLGYEFPETVMAFTKKNVHVICSVKKAKLLEGVQKVCRELTGGVEMRIHRKDRKEDGGSQITAVLEALRSETGAQEPKVAVLLKEQAAGPLMTKWLDSLGSFGAELIDAATGFGDVLATKDENEITYVKKAAFLCAQVLKLHVIPKFETVIDEEKKIKHSELAESAEKAITYPTTINVRLKQENVDIAYSPIVQSGGVYDLKPSALTNDSYLHYNATGVIFISLGARYSSYCANIARSYLIDATKDQEKAYRALLKAQEAAIAALRPGTQLADVYQAAVAAVKAEAPELVQYLTRSAGTGIGLEFRETFLLINEKNKNVVKPNMVFNVVVGFQKLPNPSSDDPAMKEYALQLADTVIVKPAGAPEIATAVCSKSFTEVAYSFKDEGEEEEEEEEEEEADVKPRRERPRDEPMATRNLRSDYQEATKEALRREKQKELAEKKTQETADRLMKMNGGTSSGPVLQRGGDFVAYRNVDDVPTTKDLMIMVDQKNEAVLLPIYGLMVPFHISTVKSITSSQEGGIAYMRINFNVPGAAFGANYAPALKNPDSIFLREVSYRTTDVRHSSQIVTMLKTLRRQVAQRESERADRATLVTQERLQLGKGRVPRLVDLWVRPAFGGRGRKLTGTLEAHANGFRYDTGRSEERVDVMYGNIKHAIFQPAENEMITLVHFHLHHPIMVGKKKTQDVQFYAEVMDIVQTLNGGRRSTYDPDEIEEEQRERERRNKINQEFEQFVKRASEILERDHKELELEFDVPFRELGFHGVPFKSAAFIVPTVNCLVELIEMPFLVITLDEIEIVSLERVGTSKKSFDMVVIFKDFKRDVHRIDSIPTQSLDSIKDWLNSMSIKYYESRLPLVWKTILKTIMDDPEKFVEEGGWEFLNMEGSDEEGGSSEDSEGYEPSGDEEEDEEEESEAGDDDDDESVVDSEEEESEEDEEEEEEGKSWDELEAEAKRADREHGDEVDSEEERRKRRAKGGGGRAPPSSSRVPPPRSRGPPPPAKRVRR